jgi:hypothetical protein
VQRLDPRDHERSVRADPDAPRGHERLAIHLEQVDRAGAAADDAIERAGHVAGDPVGAREIITGSQWDDPERNAGSGELLRDHPDGTVATGRHHDGRPLLSGHARAHDLRRFEGGAAADDLDSITTTERTFGGLTPVVASNAARVRVRNDQRRRSGARWGWAV